MKAIKKEDFKKIYRDLESRVMFELGETIDKSGYISKHTNTKAIKVDVEFYDELTSINGKLFFIDKKGLHYDYFNVGLDCLIDFLDKKHIITNAKESDLFLCQKIRKNNNKNLTDFWD